MTSRSLLLLCLCTLLGSCSEPASETPAATTSTPPPAATATPAQGAEITADNQGVLTNNQRDALNNANDLTNQLQQADAERRKQLESQQ